MLEKVGSALRDHCLIQPGAIVVVAVSGGPDSLCLLDVMHRLGFQITLAHFNHGLRPDADADAVHVQRVAENLGVPFVLGGADVRAAAAAEGKSLEEAARRLRYAFLFTTARQIGAQAVVVGHTADDQVETVLMHFIRGAGLQGLRGMAYRTVLPAFDPSIPVARPLLDVWREEILAYVSSTGLTPLHDTTNESLDFFRNRLRHELIPALESYNPRLREVVWRSAQALSSDYELLQELIRSEWEGAVREQTEDYIAFEAARLATSPRGLQRQLLRQAVEHLAPDAQITFELLERAASFSADASRFQTDLTAGLSLFREGQIIYVVRDAHKLPLEAWPQMTADSDAIRISLPQRVDLAGGWHFVAQSPVTRDASPWLPGPTQDPFRVWLDADGLPEHLELRVRRPGDRFQPLGLEGHSQKLSDFLINAKVPSRARVRWPLLCAGDDVIWIPGLRAGERHRLRDESRRAVLFSVVRIP
jgi:tRNA(Ile)-lysidine synthase